MDNNNNFFEITCNVHSVDYKNMVSAINQGIDSFLTAFTESSFEIIGDRLYCNIFENEIEILLRRLLSLNNDDADILANDIVYIQYGKETI